MAKLLAQILEWLRSIILPAVTETPSDGTSSCAPDNPPLAVEEADTREENGHEAEEQEQPTNTITQMYTSQAGLDLIKTFEGYRNKAYLDQAGIPTIGYGHTKDVKMGMTCDKTTAEMWLRSDLSVAEDEVNRMMTQKVVSLTQHQFDALVSLIFNIGTASFRISTLRKMVIASPSNAAIREEFHKWSKVTVSGAKQVSQGLLNRRKKEADLYFTD